MKDKIYRKKPTTGAKIYAVCSTKSVRAGPAEIFIDFAFKLTSFGGSNSFRITSDAVVLHNNNYKCVLTN